MTAKKTTKATPADESTINHEQAAQYIKPLEQYYGLTFNYDGGDTYEDFIAAASAASIDMAFKDHDPRKQAEADDNIRKLNDLIAPASEAPDAA